MIAKLFTLATFATLALAGGYPSGHAGASTENSCNVGEQMCCNQVQDAKSADVTQALGLLNIPIGAVTGQVGLGCNPISVIGLGSNSCNAQPVCCTDNNYNGLVAIGCSPLAINA